MVSFSSVFSLILATTAIVLIIEAVPQVFYKGTASVASFSQSPISPLSKRSRTTHYSVGLGACGMHNDDNEHVVALNGPQFGSVPGSSPWCFTCIHIHDGHGRSANARIVDKCPGCPQYGLDMSPSLFKVFSPLSVGVIETHWHPAPCPGEALTHEHHSREPELVHHLEPDHHVPVPEPEPGYHNAPEPEPVHYEPVSVTAQEEHSVSEEETLNQINVMDNGQHPDVYPFEKKQQFHASSESFPIDHVHVHDHDNNSLSLNDEHAREQISNDQLSESHPHIDQKGMTHLPDIDQVNDKPSSDINPVLNKDNIVQVISKPDNPEKTSVNHIVELVNLSSNSLGDISVHEPSVQQAGTGFHGLYSQHVKFMEKLFEKIMLRMYEVQQKPTILGQ